MTPDFTAWFKFTFLIKWVKSWVNQITAWGYLTHLMDKVHLHLGGKIRGHQIKKNLYRYAYFYSFLLKGDLKSLVTSGLYVHSLVTRCHAKTIGPTDEGQVWYSNIGRVPSISGNLPMANSRWRVYYYSQWEKWHFIQSLAFSSFAYKLKRHNTTFWYCEIQGCQTPIFKRPAGAGL